jgi:hypothetical protein
MARPPFVPVTQEELREIFNREVLPRIERGELWEMVVNSGVPRPEARQPAGTRSEVVDYFDTPEGRLRKVARIHRYKLPNGSIGASGKPDPKLVEHDGRRYCLAKRTPP